MSDDTGKKDDSLKGKVTEAVGWLTADREAEAKGKAERLAGGEEVTDDDVEAVEKDLRQDYEEYDPAVDDQPVAADVTPADGDDRTG